MRSATATPREAYRVLDASARKRRLKQEIDQLERDNYHDDPHPNIKLSKKVPKFEDSDKSGERRRGNLRLKLLNLNQLIEEDARRPAPNYTTAVAPDPAKFNLPQRHFCAVCGFNGKYTCVTCGARFCSINCQTTHKETRCMKWIT
jgi:zinc finger HIT domain-containing protein 1